MAVRTKEALSLGKTVVYDACNINAKRRKGFLTQMGKFSCEKICIVCAVPYEVCLERNRKRERQVPDEVIKRMYLNWNLPYYNEGWNKIELAYSEGSKESFGSPEAFADSLKDYIQDNPHHSETLGEHLYGARDYLIENGHCKEDSNLAVAALLHDCGKPFTKGFFDGRGNATEIAHYYQHAPAGSYDAMFFDYGEKTVEDILEIAVLIGFHMHPFAWGPMEGSGKQAKKLGNELFEKVMLLHEADKAASIMVTEE